MSDTRKVKTPLAGRKMLCLLFALTALGGAGCTSAQAQAAMIPSCTSGSTSGTCTPAPPTSTSGISLPVIPLIPQNITRIPWQTAWVEKWLAAMMMMTEQLAATMMQQTFIIGTFFDAQQQIKTQLLLQELAADAHKAYQPGVEMCVFGTGVKSLAASDVSAKANATIINEIMLNRDTLNTSSAAKEGAASDYSARLDQFVRLYCDQRLFQTEIKGLCKRQGDPKRFRKDVDFTRNVDLPYTLDIDFTDTTLTSDEEDILALSKYLFANRPFEYVSGDFLDQAQADAIFADIRSVQAMRSVARYSFANMIGMKAKGATEATPYLKKIVETMGVPEAEIEQFIGKNPSYFAQMELLTSKLYQTPNFYINLYTGPDNVRRTQVALQALQLMQDRDRYDSALRRELLVSLIAEARLRRHQDNVSDSLTRLLPDYIRGQFN